MKMDESGGKARGREIMTSTKRNATPDRFTRNMKTPTLDARKNFYHLAGINGDRS